MSFLFYSFGIAVAYNTPKSKPKWISKNIFQTDVFIENKGQFGKMFNKDILYKELRDNIYFTKEGFIIEKIKITWKRENLSSKGKYETQKSYVEYKFINTNPKVVTELTEMKKEGYYTFGDLKEYFKGYKKLIYKNIYPNIDIEFSIHSEKGMKYNFVIHPGGDVNDIKIQLHSKDYMKINESGDIEINTPIGNIIDKKPIAYQNGKRIDCGFNLNESILSFNLNGNYSTQQDLIIDPWVIVPSALPNNIGYDVDYDQYGNVYCGGITSSSVPTNVDLVLVKYNASGTFQWSYTLNYSCNCGSGPYYGEFSTLPSGSTIWGEVGNSLGVNIRKISANGTLQLNTGPFSLKEMWTFFTTDVMEKL